MRSTNYEVRHCQLQKYHIRSGHARSNGSSSVWGFGRQCRKEGIYIKTLNPIYIPFQKGVNLSRRNVASVKRQFAFVWPLGVNVRFFTRIFCMHLYTSGQAVHMCGLSGNAGFVPISSDLHTLFNKLKLFADLNVKWGRAALDQSVAPWI